MKIASIDFETANESRVSICAVGIAIFESGKLTDSRHWLVKPPRGHDHFEFTYIHHIKSSDVKDAPEFRKIARDVCALLTDANLVIAHNTAFDMPVLLETLKHYGQPIPTFPLLCTYRVSKRIWPDLPSYRLNKLAAHIGHTFKHHQAQDDAETAGHVLQAMMREKNSLSSSDFMEKAGIKPGILSPEKGYVRCTFPKAKKTVK